MSKARVRYEGGTREVQVRYEREYDNMPKGLLTWRWHQSTSGDAVVLHEDFEFVTGSQVTRRWTRSRIYNKRGQKTVRIFTNS